MPPSWPVPWGGGGHHGVDPLPSVTSAGALWSSMATVAILHRTQPGDPDRVPATAERGAGTDTCVASTASPPRLPTAPGVCCSTQAECGCRDPPQSSGGRVGPIAPRSLHAAGQLPSSRSGVTVSHQDPETYRIALVWHADSGRGGYNCPISSWRKNLPYWRGSGSTLDHPNSFLVQLAGHVVGEG